MLLFSNYVLIFFLKGSLKSSLKRGNNLQWYCQFNRFYKMHFSTEFLISRVHLYISVFTHIQIYNTEFGFSIIYSVFFLSLKNDA